MLLLEAPKTKITIYARTPEGLASIKGEARWNCLHWDIQYMRAIVKAELNIPGLTVLALISSPTINTH